MHRRIPDWKSLSKNPLDYIALNSLGLILMEMKRYDAAKNEFDKAIKLNQQYPPNYNNLLS